MDLPQAMSAQPLEEVLGSSSKPQPERKPRPQPEQALKCPRCDSTNTKFCYYNNYSLSQPRYFCKTCRRYWTQGGSLRNVPVGGGCRKNKRSSSSSKRAQDQPLPTACNNQLIPNLPALGYDSSDLTLAFARLHRQPPMGFDDHDLSLLGNPNLTHPDLLGDQLSTCNSHVLDALKHSFFDEPNGFHNFYQGLDEVLPAEETASATLSTITTIKQEPYRENQILSGFNWQQNGDSNYGVADAGRDYWNGSGSWLLNSSFV